jgi:hypothetical protein
MTKSLHPAAVLTPSIARSNSPSHIARTAGNNGFTLRVRQKCLEPTVGGNTKVCSQMQHYSTK